MPCRICSHWLNGRKDCTELCKLRTGDCLHRDCPHLLLSDLPRGEDLSAPCRVTLIQPPTNSSTKWWSLNFCINAQGRKGLFQPPFTWVTQVEPAQRQWALFKSSVTQKVLNICRKHSEKIYSLINWLEGLNKFYYDNMLQNNMFKTSVLYIYMNSMRILGKYQRMWEQSSWTERILKNWNTVETPYLKL